MHLGADEETSPAPLIPARMINEFTYCPRLFYLEFVQGEFVDNEFTVEGNFAHRRVDAKATQPAEPGDPRAFEARSVSLSSEKLGLSAKMDLLEGEGGAVTPVDYKRGRPPTSAPHGAYDPERVQLCAYGLLLREHGYQTTGGVLYFAESKTRVEVPFDDELVALTLQMLADAAAVARGGLIPPPLVASRKCQGCSLHSVCLPDEVAKLRGESEQVPRHFVPARDDAQPLYVQEQGASVGVSGEVLEVRGREKQKLAQVRLTDTSQVVLWGNVQISAQAARELMSRTVPICWMSYGGWLSGLSDGFGHGNIELRRAQFRRADDESFSLNVAQRIVRAKIANCRTVLRRSLGEEVASEVRELASCVDRVAEAKSAEELLGVEGNAARIYFSRFSGMLKPKQGATPAFDFTTRTRRPPKDPTNALLSLAYSLLARDFAVTTRLTGFDPYLGFYHRPRFGRPALALDLMEEFRPIIADSVVLTAVNTGVVGPDDFVRSSLGVALKAEPRKAFIKAYERRLAEQVTHPVFGYRISYRRVLEVQARLFARFLAGEIADYPEFRTR